MESNPEMFGKIPEQTILIEISANGDVHITHDVKHDTSIRFVEFVKGTTSNVEVHDSRSGEEVEFGVAGYGEVGGVQIYDLSPVLVEYDLDDALGLVDGMWYWDYLYTYGTAKFFLPDGVDFVYVNDRYADLGDSKGLSCHGCGLKLGYYINAEPLI